MLRVAIPLGVPFPLRPQGPAAGLGQGFLGEHHPTPA